MLRSLDTSWLRVASFAAVAIVAAVAGVRERRHVKAHPNLWPTFWFVTAFLFLAMAVARVGDFGELATRLGREQAITQGWYGDRRKYQAVVVGAVAGIWFVMVAVALWRVPERRRRYLPMAIVTLTLMCYAGVRSVSLHQIDSLLYRRDIAGARVVAVVDFIGVAVAMAVALWLPRSAPPPRHVLPRVALPPPHSP
jgi:small basic protein